MKNVILVILKYCSETLLIEIMINHAKDFESTLQRPVKSPEMSTLDTYFLVKEKSFLFLIFEIFYAWISKESIKDKVHWALYGPQTKGNELNISLIKICTQAKKSKIDGFENLSK